MRCETCNCDLGSGYKFCRGVVICFDCLRRFENLEEKNKQLFEETDRYQALGIPYPDENSCDGECEGTGFVPVPKDCKEEQLKQLWLEAEKKKPTDDDWHFVVCPKYKGTRQKNRPNHSEKED